jgi:hypothetical protein
LVFGSIATWMTGSGNVMRLEDDRVVRVAQGVAGGGVLEADDGHDVAGARPTSISSRLLACIRQILPMRSLRLLGAS